MLKLNRLIHWHRIEKHLVGIHKNDINPEGGPVGYNKLALLKAILIKDAICNGEGWIYGDCQSGRTALFEEYVF